MKPQAGEVIQDPAAGTGGFLVAADRYIKGQTDDLYKLTQAQAFFQTTQCLHRRGACAGYAPPLPDEPHAARHRGRRIAGWTRSRRMARACGKADLILTNPPFGTKKGGGRPTRSDFSITADTSNKQLAFVEHIVRALKPGGTSRGGGAGQRAVRGQHRTAAADVADGSVRPAHDPAAADRHLLRPGREDERAVPGEALIS